jgi:peptide/nickel transport system permease protein
MSQALLETVPGVTPLSRTERYVAPSGLDNPDIRDNPEGQGHGTAERTPQPVPEPVKPSSFARFSGLLRLPSLILALVVLATVIAWAIIPSVFTPYDAVNGTLLDRLQPPSATHPFGTDNLGRDTLARFIYGSQTTLLASGLAVVIALGTGALLGLLAGYLRGFVDEAIMRFMDVILAIPALLLSLTIITGLGFGTLNIAIAVGLASTAAFARIMRSQVLSVATAGYIEAAKLSGARWPSIIFRQVLPAAITPVLALAAIEFGAAVLAISALSFLGFGAPPPQPEWGALISEGRDYLQAAWWLTTLPGLVIVAVVLSTARLSRWLQDRGDRS